MASSFEIKRAEARLPAIMNFRSSHISTQPYKGKGITFMLNITAATAVVIETFTMLGASVRVCSSTTLSIRDNFAAAIAYYGIPIFVKQDQTLEERISFMKQALDWGSYSPDAIICNRALDFDEYETTGSDNRFCKIAENFTLKNENKKIVADFESLYSIAMEPMRGLGLRDLDDPDEIPLLPSYRYFLPEILKRATNGNIVGKKVAVLGYGDAGKECAVTLMNAGACVAVFHGGKIHYCGMGPPVQMIHNEDAFSDFDIIVSSGAGHGEDTVIQVDHMKCMKNGAIVWSIGDGSGGNGIDMQGLRDFPGVKCFAEEPEMEKWVFDHGTSIVVLNHGRPLKLGCVSKRIETMNYFISKIRGLDKCTWLIIFFIIFCGIAVERMDFMS
ncbi:adenosylhomocysteinase-like [Prosopis cineraria]|uniref:adenosylhomocysteinase-like n=1 Tax=Prosopis cineraria TaxID=364024 RepID=UPI00240EB111|nr:adenosylhomocysteinase-like [Prosopis cineraria]